MRIDLGLSRLCLFKTRSQATKACQDGRVWVNGQKARASRDLRVGDRVRFRDPWSRREEEVEILELPEGSVSKSRAREMVKVIETRVLDDPWERAGKGDGS